MLALGVAALLFLVPVRESVSVTGTYAQGLGTVHESSSVTVPCARGLSSGLAADGPNSTAAMESESAPVAQTVEPTQIPRLDNGEIIVTSHFAGHVLAAHMFGVVEAPPETVWTVLTDINRWSHFGIPGLHESRLIPEERADELTLFRGKPSYKMRDFVRQQIPLISLPRKLGGMYEALAFQYYDFPWPVSDRWVLLKVSHNERQRRAGAFKASWVMVKGNVKTVTGYFLVTPFKNNPDRALVSYQIDSDAGISVPRFLLRYGTNRILPKVMQALRRESKE